MNRIGRWVRILFRQLQNFLENFLLGDRIWGQIRLVGVFVAAVAFMLLGAFIWERNLLNDMILDWRENYGLFKSIPHRLMLPLVAFFAPQSLRYLIAPLTGVTGALLLGARYVQDIYELRSYRLAFRYIFASLFGIGYPSLIIEDGRMQVMPDEENLLQRVGGPGYVIIRPGNVVLFERLDNPSSVRSDGTHFISRFETIEEIASLQDQQGEIEELEAVTKDGVIVTARDIHYRYRLASSGRQADGGKRTPQNPYPFAIQAVRNMAYNRPVTVEGLVPWLRVVQGTFQGEIQNYIRQHQLDQVTAPRSADADPREDIHNLYRTNRFRNGFRRLGAVLEWYGIGHFEVDNAEVNDQRVSTWQAGWRGDAEVIRAYSDALLQAYKEQGRAEAQAEILMSIFYALNDGNPPGGSGSEAGVSKAERTQRLQRLFLFRVAQLLEAMRQEGRQIGPGGE